MTYLYIFLILAGTLLISLFGFKGDSKDFSVIKTSLYKASGIVIANLLSVSALMYNLISYDFSYGEYIALAIVIFLLIYLISFDGFYFEIPALATYALVGLSTVILLIQSFTDLSVFPSIGNSAANVSSFVIAGLVYGAIYLFLWLITNKQGMGDGDIYIALATGFLLGGFKTVISFYITLALALLFSLGVIIKTKKVKGVRIPFVPFMGYGLLLAAGINAPELISFLLF